MRGTMTLPNDIRAALSISEGDIVEFEVHRVVRKAPSSPSTSTASPQPFPKTALTVPGDA
jgi:bifunctional DNA-binding transcriptional regulator/antitoxin component of YhaV-PrlF toxin-antitoxin module